MTATTDLGSALDQLLARAQRTYRYPGVSAAAGAGGNVLWTGSISAGPDTQYRIGSITKTFTAAATLLLAEDGHIDIDSRLDEHLPGTSIGRATLRQLLGHTAGIPREASTAMWQTFAGPDRDELVASLKDTQPAASPGSRWNYSNLGYALLGEVIARTTDDDARLIIERKLLRPLGLARTSWNAEPPAAPGHRVDPYADALHTEPDMDQGSVGVGGQLWSTTGDLLAWSQVLLGRRPDALPERITGAMHTLHAMVDPERWDEGWGLGLRLVRQGSRVLAGHTGAMPGFTSSLLLHRPTEVHAVVLVNATRAEGVDELACTIVDRVIENPDSDQVGPWQPGPPCPPEVEAMLGPWWSESDEIVLTWATGRLRAHLTRSPKAMSTFDQEGPDVFRVSAGRWHGERLIVQRDELGRPEQLEWATYPLTRRPS